jgi:GTPase SAR1 family protein
MKFFETSAKTGENVNDMFLALAEEMVKRAEQKLNPEAEAPSPNVQKKRKCIIL